ncbi:hypothetical protein BOTBODRAFT_34617 [Botryobasidium botryosum FD-172 SS1]|uniref:PhoD-like phosphatase metallophosphatase domain-containing protein n=1 Tax=Botryobasidium botryosum (strain FD-172 SS1) TaxID=930990 RepID=A0A067MCE1_BOTB1|nr:hypothetical protein BOTBODRAFT_34617 [Botryobasidium botryosum FD-172 SS1]
MSSTTLKAISSTLFRIGAYIFLRIFPGRSLGNPLLALYGAYLILWSYNEVTGLSSGVETQANTTITEVKGVNGATNGETNEKDEIAKVDVKPAVVPSTDSFSPLNATLFDLPHPAFGIRLLGFAINLVFFLAAVDFVFKPLFIPHNDVIFTRIGAVDPDGVKVLIRYPGVEGSEVKIMWKETATATGIEHTLGLSGWKDGPTVALEADNDWVAVGRISGLWPSTSYKYRLAYPNSTFLPYPESPIRFKTFPDPRLPVGTHFRFVASSCILPNFPYVPFKPSNRIPGLDLLAAQLWPSSSEQILSPSASNPVESSEVPAHITPDVPDAPAPTPEQEAAPTLESTGAEEIPLQTPPEPEPEVLFAATTSVEQPTPEPSSATAAELPSLAPTSTPSAIPEETEESSIPTEFLLLLGDFIYADTPVYARDNREAYRRYYRQNYASESFRKVYERIPTFYIYDDHEIVNNYAGQSNDSAQFFQSAKNAYDLYSQNTNYDNLANPGEYYYDFRYGDNAFFVMDTRRHRSNAVNPREGEVPTMLGEKQLVALHQWLGKVNQTTTFKFLISSVPLSALWAGPDGQTETWAGYPAERDTLLALLASVPNVVVISGDRHEFAAIEYLGGTFEFSVSPLNQFYAPLVRTFSAARSKMVQVKKSVEKVVTGKKGEDKIVLEEVVESVPEEKVLKYIPAGNHKWATFDVDTTDRAQPKLTVEVTIDGKRAWEYTIIGHPIALTSTTALGTKVTEGLKGILDKISFNPTSWF